MSYYLRSRESKSYHDHDSDDDWESVVIEEEQPKSNGKKAQRKGNSLIVALPTVQPSLLPPPPPPIPQELPPPPPPAAPVPEPEPEPEPEPVLRDFDEPYNIELLPPTITDAQLEKLVADERSQEEQNLPQPSTTIEMDLLIGKLESRAKKLDTAAAFKPGYPSHIAQLKRDLYMYIYGMKAKIPPKWNWALNDILEEERQTERLDSDEFQQFLSLANQLGYKIPNINEDRIAEKGAPKFIYQGANEKDDQPYDKLMEKYKLSDAGQTILQIPPPSPKKISVAKAMSGPGKRKFSENGGGKGSSTVLVESSDDDDNSDDTEKPSFLRPFKKPRKE